MKLFVRRGLVVGGVFACLLLGVASIQAAAVWTRAAAPLAAPPVSVEELQGQLQAERDRSAALQAQFEQLTSQASDLTSALDAANKRVAGDVKNADALRAQLKATQAQLAALKKALAAAPVRPAAPPAAGPPAAGGGGGGDD